MDRSGIFRDDSGHNDSGRKRECDKIKHAKKQAAAKQTFVFRACFNKKADLRSKSRKLRSSGLPSKKRQQRTKKTHEDSIVDDEENVCLKLKELLLSEDVDSRIDLYLSADQLLLAADKYNLIFLDIQMPGINGMEAARQVRRTNRQVEIIFVSASKEYVFEAFDVGAFHYLLKPICREKFSEVYALAKAECLKKNLSQKKQIVVRTRQEEVTIETAKILYAESLMKKIVLYTMERNVAYYGQIHQLEKQLGEGFYRCHRSYLVNMAYISGYERTQIRLTDGSCVYMSKERYSDFRKCYMQYLQNGGTCFV